MILPVTLYGDPLLRKVAQEIDLDDPKLPSIIENMFETMYKADGVGLAAPQVGISKRIFVIDASPAAEEEPELKDFKKAFINPEIIETKGTPWSMEEGCLSLPNIRENVSRAEEVTIEYFNEKGELLEETYNGFAARVILHEYDHLEGKLFIDYINPLRKRMIKGKLTDIAKGKTSATYKTKAYAK